MKVVSKGLFKSISEFRVLEKKLGNGSFGVVKLAVHKYTGRLYAIKIIQLDNMPSEVEVKLVERQIRIHSQLTHPHCISLWDTFSEDNHIYMILQYAQQGNLFFYQNNKQTFSQPEAALLFSQTAKALQYLHCQDIMHRDIKPENLLLDHNFNIKLCDFGWCAENIRTQRSTFCGTYEYMAPQMIFQANYDYRVDIWALGILIYQMVHGYAPFRGDSVNEVKQRMLKGSYELSDSLSESLKQLITEILKFDPQQRISLKQILNSQWVREMQQVISDCAQKIQLGQTFQQLIRGLEQKQKPQREGNSSKKQKQHTKNINFNLSINNFAYIKNSDRQNFHSPGHIFAQKKKKKEKQDKRCRTQAQEQLMELAQSLSPKKGYLSKDIQGKREKRQDKIKRNVRQRGRKSQQNTQKSPFRQSETNQFAGRTPSKLSSILKKRSVHQKLSNAVSLKSIQKIKTGMRTYNNMSGLNY